ncbi:hypothetical protein BAY59_06210 [Prauserella coralliicola]|nr:hypothetical protein BAY59_06210 [Prauserella coralliicola]
MRASELLSAALPRFLIVVGVAAGGWLLTALLSSAALASTDEPCAHGTGVTSAVSEDEPAEPREEAEPVLPEEAAEHAATADGPVEQAPVPGPVDGPPPAPEPEPEQTSPLDAQVEPPAPVAPEPRQTYTPQNPVGGLLGTVNKTVNNLVGTVTTTVHNTVGTVPQTVQTTVNGVTGALNGTIEGIAPIVDVPGTLPELGITLPEVDLTLPSVPEAGSGDGAVIAVPADPVPATVPDRPTAVRAPAQDRPATAAPQATAQSDATLLATTPVPSSAESNATDAPEAGGGGAPGGGGPLNPLPAGPVSFATGSCSIAAPQDNAAGRSVHGILSWAPTLTQLRLIGASRDHDADGAGREAALPTTTPD